jgi:hypothetical protein
MSWLKLRRLGDIGFQVSVRLPVLCNGKRNFLRDPPYDISLVRKDTRVVS